MSMIMVHRPRYRQDKQQPERDQNCEQYIDEVLAIIYDDDYFDTRLSKTSRIAAITKSWVLISEFHGYHRWCDNCGEQYKHDELYSEGFANSKQLCKGCNNNTSVNKRKSQDEMNGDQ